MAKEKYTTGKRRKKIEIVATKEGSGTATIVASDGVDRIPFQFRYSSKAFDENPDTGEPFFMQTIRRKFEEMQEEENQKVDVKKFKGKKYKLKKNQKK